MNNIRFWGSECAQNIKPNILACFNELTRIMLFFFIILTQLILYIRSTCTGGWGFMTDTCR